MRHDHAERAIVEAARAFIERACADAHDWRDAGRQRRDAELRRLVRRNRAVLHVDEQPVVAGRGREHRGTGGAQVMHAEAERKLAALEFLFCGVLDHRHVSPPFATQCLECASAAVKQVSFFLFARDLGPKTGSHFSGHALPRRRCSSSRGMISTKLQGRYR